MTVAGCYFGTKLLNLYNGTCIMGRFKTRREFIDKSITLSLGVGLTKMSVLEEVIKTLQPNNQLQSSELKNLIDNSPLVAFNKMGDPGKEGMCLWDFSGYMCSPKK